MNSSTPATSVKPCTPMKTAAETSRCQANASSKGAPTPASVFPRQRKTAEQGNANLLVSTQVLKAPTSQDRSSSLGTHSELPHKNHSSAPCPASHLPLDQRKKTEPKPLSATKYEKRAVRGCSSANSSTEHQAFLYEREGMPLSLSPSHTHTEFGTSPR